MNTAREEETSFNPLIQPRMETNPVSNDRPSSKEILTRKVAPLEETPTKVIEKNVEKAVRREDNKGQITPISLSIEDLKAIYEKRKSQKERQILHIEDAHKDAIASVVATSDNKYIITGSDDRSIKIFSMETKQQVHHFENVHEDNISSVAVTPDNKFIISGSRDQSIKIFDIEAKQLVYNFENAHTSYITTVAVTPDNKYIISGGWDMSIKIFNMSTKQQIHHFEGAHKHYVTSLAVTSDSKFLISGSWDQSIKVFDLNTRQEIHHFEKAHEGWVSTVAVSLDNKYIISGSFDKSIKVFDLETKQLVHHFENAHPHIISSVAAAGNRYIVSGSADYSIKIFDIETKQQVHHFEQSHKAIVNSVRVTADSKYIISGSSDCSVKVFDIQIGAKDQVHHFENVHEDGVHAMTVAPNGRYLISSGFDCSIKVFDLSSMKLVRHFESAHPNFIYSLAVTPDSKYIISGSSDLSIKIFDIENKQQVHHFENVHEDRVHSLAVSPDGKYLVSCSDDGSIKAFDLGTRQQFHHFENAHRREVTSVTITADSKYIISGSYDCSIKVFDLNTKQLVYHFQNAHENWISSVLVTSDNKYIISSSADTSIKVFDFSTKQQVHHFKNAHRYWVSSAVLTSDDQYIISSSADNSIKIFDLELKQQIHQFENVHKDYVRMVTVTSNGQYIISGSEDGSMKVLRFQTQQKNDGLPDIHHQNCTRESFLKALNLGTREQALDPKKQASSSREEEALLLIRDPSILTHDLNFIFESMRRFSFFNCVGHYLFDKPLHISVAEAVRHSELFVLPFGWTILHLVSVSANHDFIENMPEYSGFKMPFLVDALGYTPLHYLVAHKSVNFMTVNIVFRYICDYLEDCQLRNPFEFQKIIETLGPLLSFIFKNVETKLRQRFLQITYSKSSLPFHNKPPIFGNILLESAIFCDSPVLTQETREKIWDEKGTTQIEFRSNYLCLDYNVLSQDMKDMVDSLKTQASQDIFKTPAITTLIDHLWAQAETPLMIFFAFYSAFIIALSVYLTLRDRSLPFEIVLLVISASFTISELWQIYNLKKDYLESLWNWFDLAHLLLTIAFLGTRITDNDDELARAWMSTIIVILGYLRWISLLKIFKPTRHLIQVVLTILKDMLSFIIVIALIIIGFSLIFLVFNREAGYGDYLYEAYNVLYGPMDIEEDAAWPFSQKLLMAVLAFFLNVVLLNLLISIMGDSYGQVLEMRDKTEALTRLEMISEAVILRKFLNPNYQTKRGYLVYCLPVELDGDENNENPELGNIIKTVKSIIQRNNEESKQESQDMKNEILNLKASNEKMKNEILSLKETILNEFLKLQKSTVLNK